MAKPPVTPKPGKSGSNNVPVPHENVELLQTALGIDLTASSDILIARISATIEASSSPYTSAEMLEDYVRRGMPDVKDRVLDTIDEERHWRHAREEQEQAHRHAMERAAADQTATKIVEEHAQQRRSQRNAFIIALSSLPAAMASEWLGFSNAFCISLIVIGIGGPSSATILARIMDKFKS